MYGKGSRLLILLLVALLLAALGALGILAVRMGWVHRLLVRHGLAVERRAKGDDYALQGWEASLESLNCRVDVVFFGDSMAYYTDWGRSYPDVTLCNLGYRGDTVHGLLKRTGMVRALAPRKVFLLIGGNNMKYRRYAKTLDAGYRSLAADLREKCPEASLYMVSILPTRAPYPVESEAIRAQNRRLQALAEELDLTYVDAHTPLLDEGGELALAWSRDGVHLSDAGARVLTDALAPYVYG